jgi:uncharacterized UPF0160 family protein
MTKIIVTHNGQFHADEVFAYTLLNTIFPDNKLVRTRDTNIIEKADIVIDVGFTYNPDKDRFDHHQEDCNETFTDDILISSAGMVYKKYGISYLKTILGVENISEELYLDFYKNLVEEVDAIDNGLKQNNDKFTINTGISRMVARFNSDKVFDNDIQFNKFMEAVKYTEYVSKIITIELYSKDTMFAEEYKRISLLIDENNDKQYIIVDFDCLNWYKCVNKYYNKNTHKNIINWIIYKDNENWRIRTINYESKKLKDEKYLRDNVNNKDEILFVHKAKFIASASTLETIVEIAELSSD